MGKTRNAYDEQRYRDTFPTKFREELCVTAEDVKKLTKELGCSAQAISQYKLGVCPSTEKLVKIARFYGCSLDYLIGLSDVKSPDADIQAICQYTGLSAEAVELLHFLNETTDKENKRTLSFLNTVLSDPRFTPGEDKSIETVFSQLDQYIHSQGIKRRIYGDSKLPETVEEFRISEAMRKVEETTVTVESSDDMSEIISLAKLYRRYKWDEIRDSVNYYLDKEQEAK